MISGVPISVIIIPSVALCVRSVPPPFMNLMEYIANVCVAPSGPPFVRSCTGRKYEKNT